ENGCSPEYSQGRRMGMRRLMAAYIVMGSTLSAAGQAQEMTAVQKLHLPAQFPDRIVLTWRGEPTRSQAVTWRTDTTIREAVGQIAIAEAGPDFAAKARTVPAVTT